MSVDDPKPESKEEALRKTLKHAHDVIVGCIGPLEWNSGGTYLAGTNVYALTRESLAECITIHDEINEVLGGCCSSGDEDEEDG